VTLAVGWVAVETRSLSPLVDMKMMRIKVVWTANLVALLVGFGMYAAFAFIPEFVETNPSSGYGFGAGVTHAGLLLLPFTVLMFTFGIASGRVILKIGPKSTLLAGAVISVAAFTMLALAHTNQWEVAMASGLLGAGFGLAFAAMSGLIVEGVPAQQTGVASGMNANIRTIGGAIGAALMSSVVAATAHGGHPPTETGYTRGFGMLAVAALAAVVAAMLVPSRERPLSAAQYRAALPHPELGIVAAGPLVGDESE
jgi:MFS family permease